MPDRGLLPVIRPPLPADEPARLAALRALRVLDAAAEAAFDELTRLAALVCETPIALISLVDADRQWTLSRVGLALGPVPREHAFCAHAIADTAPLTVVPDALLDARFESNPLVRGEPGIRFYAGSPVLLDSGHAVGTICAMDRQPRALTPAQQTALPLLSRQVARLLQLRRDASALRPAEDAPGQPVRRPRRRDAQPEREQSLARLTQHSQRQQEFIYMVSHDLREPVNTICNFAGLLGEQLEALPASAPAHRYLGFVRDGGQRMRAMLDDLLVYVRLDAPLPAPVPIELGTLLRQVVADLDGPIRAARAQLQLDLQGRVQGHPTPLRLLLQNLLSNAVKFHRPGRPPQVRVWGEARIDRFRVHVADDGIGIPASHLPKLFGCFRRHTTPQDYPGTGIGLATCRRIVELHHGRIDVASVEGEGTTFTVELPWHPPAP
jgi:signal transduction histidine kinase